MICQGRGAVCALFLHSAFRPPRLLVNLRLKQRKDAGRPETLNFFSGDGNAANSAIVYGKIKLFFAIGRAFLAILMHLIENGTGKFMIRRRGGMTENH